MPRRGAITSEVIAGRRRVPDGPVSRLVAGVNGTETIMWKPRTSLQAILLLDAASCAAMGLALVLLASPLAAFTALPERLLFWSGFVLLPVAALIAVVALRPGAGPAPRLVILANLLWVIGSLAILLGGWVHPNGLGATFILGQAAFVTALSALEWAGLPSERGEAQGRGAAA